MKPQPMAKSYSIVGAKLKCLVCEDCKKKMMKNTSMPQNLEKLHSDVPIQKNLTCTSIYLADACMQSDLQLGLFGQNREFSQKAFAMSRTSC